MRIVIYLMRAVPVGGAGGSRIRAGDGRGA